MPLSRPVGEQNGKKGLGVTGDNPLALMWLRKPRKWEFHPHSLHPQTLVSPQPWGNSFLVFT